MTITVHLGCNLTKGGWKTVPIRYKSRRAYEEDRETSFQLRYDVIEALFEKLHGEIPEDIIETDHIDE